MSKVNLHKNLPESPGVYLMKDARGEVLYVGKAGNLRRRVASYFERPHDVRIERLVSKIKKIDHQQTEAAIEALILEAKLIKKFRPPFNIREKDDKSFLYVEIEKERFPRVLLVRGKDIASGERFGPFTSASNIREALHILRKIFPWNTHEESRIGKFPRPCFDYEIGLCPGTCVGVISRKDYGKNIRNIRLFLEGKKGQILKSLEQDMKTASKSLDFERATKLRGQIFALKHIRDIALISDSGLPPTTYNLLPTRIEGYDISNISGTSAVGSMVVFAGGQPDRNEYRKFRIRTIVGSNDVGMIKEVLRRRFKRIPSAGGWPLPDLILIDGGRGQVSAAKAIIAESGLKIPVIGIAKGPKRKRNDFIGFIPHGIEKSTLIAVRDEAHRFAISYHKKMRGREFFK